MAAMSDESRALRLGSPERFGYSWDRFAALTADQEEQFKRWTALLPPSEWKDTRFLDVGCGMGRNSYWALRMGAAGGQAIDLDDRSLAHAREILAESPSVQVRRLSAYDIDRQNEFDIVFSIGVIHHLAKPENAVRKMAAAAKPGGHVLLWLYGYENNEWIVRWVDPLRKALFSRMPLPVLHALSHIPTAMLWLWLRAGGGRTEYARLIRSFSYRHLRHIVFDQLLPRIARYYRKSEALELLHQAGLQNVSALWVNEMSWCVMGDKQAKAS
jgi:SAM-dependent methyltransferase